MGREEVYIAGVPLDAMNEEQARNLSQTYAYRGVINGKHMFACKSGTLEAFIGMLKERIGHNEIKVFIDNSLPAERGE